MLDGAASGTFTIKFLGNTTRDLPYTVTAAAMESASAKWRLTAHIEVDLDAPAGQVSLSLRYLVPAALWRPSYRAVLRPSVLSEGAHDFDDFEECSYAV